MDLAPVEYVVIGYDGDAVDAGVVPPLRKLVEAGTIRILDLVLIRKHGDGSVAYFEPDELVGAAIDSLVQLAGELEGMISDEDVSEAAQTMAPDSSAVFAIVEDLWAAELGDAVQRGGGRLLVGERIPADAIAAAAAAVAPKAPE